MRQWLAGEARTRSTPDDGVVPALARPGTRAVEPLVEHLEACLAARSANRGCGVIVCGPDRHLSTTHTFGYEFAASVLNAVFDRLASVVRADEALIHLAGHEFVVVVPDVPALRDLESLAGRLVGAMRAPVRLPDGVDHWVSVSTGVDAAFDSGVTASDLLRRAGWSRARAESEGGDRVRLARESDDVLVERQRDLEQDLRVAFEHGQFVLHYQPVVDLVTATPTCWEALVRWHHPVRQLLYPGSFLSAAEELGLGRRLDRLVLASACTQAQAVGFGSDEPAPVSVNIDGRRLVDPELPLMISEVLAETGLAADRLSLELSESAIGPDENRWRMALRNLDLLGIGFVLDNATGDPGPLDVLVSCCSRVSCKLDRSLVRYPSEERLRQASSVVTDVGGSDLPVIVQGIETKGERERVRALGFRLVQGFGVQRPLPAERIESATPEYV